MFGPRFPRDPGFCSGEDPLYPPGRRMVDTLRLLVGSGHAASVEALIEVVRRCGYPETAGFLQRFVDEPAPLELVLQALDVEVELEAHRTWRMLAQRLQDQRVGILPPLPVHLVRHLAPYVTDLLLPVGGSHLPHPLQTLSCTRHTGPRPCRHAVAGLHALAFEAYRGADGYYVRSEVLDALDAVAARGAPHLLIHARPHRLDDDDLPFRPDAPVTLL